MVVSPGAKLRGSPEPRRPRPRDPVVGCGDSSRPGRDSQTKVRLADGREGYMHDDELYSPLNYRMVVEKLRGKWMITAFIAGD